MSELASYSIQAIFFALVAVVVVSHSKKTDLYQFALISIWLVGVIAIYARYRADQVLFYSNDQVFHQQVIEIYLPLDGFQVSAVIGLRYLLTFPVYLISLLGFNAMLTIKFLQLSALLLVYKRSQQFMVNQSLNVRFWQLPLIAGPILMFMSLLSLRDVLLAYFALVFVTSVPLGCRILGLGGAFALRPHLGVALAFGFVISHFYSRWKPKLHSFSISIIALLNNGLYLAQVLELVEVLIFFCQPATYAQNLPSTKSISALTIDVLKVSHTVDIHASQPFIKLAISRDIAIGCSAETAV